MPREKSIARRVKDLVDADTCGAMELFITTAIYTYAKHIRDMDREQLARELPPKWHDDFGYCAWRIVETKPPTSLPSETE